MAFRGRKSQQDEESGSAGIRVIARAADILRSLGKHQDGLTLGEIAQLVSLPRSTVQRIVKALEDVNLVIAASPTGGVRLGPALIALAASAKQFSIDEFVKPAILQISKDTGETVDLAIMGTDKAVVVDQIPGTHPLVAVSETGSSLPLHCSASGKVLLAMLPADRLARIKSRLTLTALTKNSSLSWDTLEREIESIRRTGIAFDREEFRAGICAVAAGVRGPGNEVAAISIPVPSDRFRATEKALTKSLLDRTQALQRRL
jgi:IclR family transcriptional regulator, acetate operon repressor